MMTILTAQPSSPGIGIGSACIFYSLSAPLSPKTPSQEIARLKSAFKLFEAQIREQAEKQDDNEDIQSLLNQIALLNDEDIREQIIRNINEGASASHAVSKVLTSYMNNLSESPSASIKKRIDILKNILGKLTSILGGESVDISSLPANTVLIADELTLENAIRMDKDNICAIAAKTTGNSLAEHIAKSYSIPMVSGCDKIMDEIKSGEKLIIDGVNGKIIASPSDSQMHEYSKILAKSIRDQSLYSAKETYAKNNIRVFSELLTAAEMLPAITNGSDGYIINYDILKELSFDEQLYEIDTVLKASGELPVYLCVENMYFSGNAELCQGILKRKKEGLKISVNAHEPLDLTQYNGLGVNINNAAAIFQIDEFANTCQFIVIDTDCLFNSFLSGNKELKYDSPTILNAIRCVTTAARQNEKPVIVKGQSAANYAVRLAKDDIYAFGISAGDVARLKYLLSKSHYEN